MPRLATSPAADPHETAVFITDQGEERRFRVKFAPVHIFWRGRLWALQPLQAGAGGLRRYRETSVCTLEQLALDDERINV